MDKAIQQLLLEVHGEDRPEAERELFRHAAVGDPVLCYEALAAGASPTAVDAGGRTPMRVLIEHSAGVNAASLAACASLLLAYGADPEERDPKTGKTALMEAAQRGNIVMMDLLQRAGARADAVLEKPDGDPVEPLTALDFALCSANGAVNMDRACVRLLFNGAPADNVDFDGLTPLHRLAWHVAEGLSREGLSQEGANAVRTTIKALAERGADVNAADHDGSTALHVLAGGVSLPEPLARIFLAELLEQGADVNAIGPDGMTPLHVAAERGAVGICRFLLHHGANPTLCDAQERNPAALAHERGQFGEAMRVAFEQSPHAAVQRRRARQAAEAAPGPSEIH